MVVTTSGPGRSRQKSAPGTLQAFVDAVPLPAALLDDHGRIVALNDAWQAEARPGGLIAPTDKIGQDHVHELRDEKGFSRAAGRAMAEAIEDVLEGRRQQARHTYSLDTELGERKYEGVASSLQVEDDAYVLLVHQERTAEERAGAMSARVGDLMIAQEHMVAVARDRQRLLETAEQSFHAPLTPIRLQLHLLRNGTLGELNERQAKALERIDRNVQRWWRLQDSLITDLNQLESGGHSPGDVDAGKVLEEALQPFRARAIQAGVRLRVDAAEEPLPIHIDRRAMVQVLMMVLDHAVRQSPSGGLVWVRLRRVDDAIELVIQDQDPVMEPAEAERLLDPEAEDDSAIRSGLLHAQRVLAQDGGRVEARCAGPGRGLEVALSMPARD